MSEESTKDSVLKLSSVAPSARTMTFPGWPLFSVSLYMPLTKASITVISETTSVNARAVMTVVFQRTIRLRTL